MGDSLVLCYHAVSETWPADLAVRPSRLQSQLSALIARGYRGVTFREAVEAPAGSKRLAVTFDDAYRSVIELALPVLSRLGIPGTLFVPTAYIGTEEPMEWPGIEHWRGGPHEAELIPMSWEEITVLAAGGWEIGSHTRTHPRLTELESDELLRELTDSRRECEERLSLPCVSLAYPYGAEDRRGVEAARQAGYEAAGALPEDEHAPEPLRWPRVGIYRDDDELRFRVKTSPLMRRLRSGGRLRVPPAAWAAARRLGISG